MCHLDWAACFARRPGVTLIETTLSARRSQPNIRAQLLRLERRPVAGVVTKGSVGVQSP
jgi:hypothetical protein